MISWYLLKLHLHRFEMCSRLIPKSCQEENTFGAQKIPGASPRGMMEIESLGGDAQKIQQLAHRFRVAQAVQAQLVRRQVSDSIQFIGRHYQHIQRLAIESGSDLLHRDAAGLELPRFASQRNI